MRSCYVRIIVRHVEERGGKGERGGHNNINSFYPPLLTRQLREALSHVLEEVPEDEDHYYHRWLVGEVWYWNQNAVANQIIVNSSYKESRNNDAHL